jgi:hypothetical protein
MYYASGGDLSRIMSNESVFSRCEKTGREIRKKISMVGSTFITNAFGALSLSKVSQLTEYFAKEISVGIVPG